MAAALALYHLCADRRDSAPEVVCAANTRDQDKLNDRLANTEARLRAQYAALDTKMATLNALSTYMTQQIAACNKKTSD